MPLDPHEFARTLGAEIVGEVPEVDGGPFGMARLAQLLRERLSPSRGDRPGRPTNPSWLMRCKVPMSDRTVQTLEALAEGMSTAERKVSPMQVAAQLLEEALNRVGASAPATAPEGTGRPGKRRPADPNGPPQAPPAPVPLPSRQDGQRQARGRKAGRSRKGA